jgi:hypothetical protein
MMLESIVGFSGKIGSGKTTAALYLCDKHYYMRTRFAEPLKNMLRALGCSEAEIDGAKKQEPCDLFGGKTPRLAMQLLGTEWGRALYPDIWVMAWYRSLRSKRVVADDVRFPNEADAVRELGGIVIGLRRGALVSEFDNHASEAMDFEPDVWIDNNGTTEELYDKLDSFLKLGSEK